jgi:beta-glucosidase-like glycosyl hydrolase
MLLCSRDPELVKRIGEATALEVRATGIPYVFAPCIAVIKENTFCIFSLDGNYVFY